VPCESRACKARGHGEFKRRLAGTSFLHHFRFPSRRGYRVAVAWLAQLIGDGLRAKTVDELIPDLIALHPTPASGVKLRPSLWIAAVIRRYFKFDHETWTASRTALIQLILASFRESRPSFGHLLQLLSVSGRSRPCHVSAFCGVAKVVLDFFDQRSSRKFPS
jgi:hypothetical protein